MTYLEIAAAFDIETTNMYVRRPDGGIAKDPRPYAFMYHWQLAIDRYVIFGRTWEEWTRCIRYISNNLNLSNTNRLVIYVHNLPFEFQFFRRFVNVTEGFYKDPYKPVRVAIDEGIEFRDSLALSNMSLEMFCRQSKGCIHHKADGDLDYNIIRTAATPLSEKEKGYCYNDVAGLVECIKARMEDDTLASIPMTSTGYVRRECRNNMRGAYLETKSDRAKMAKNNRRNFVGTALNPVLYQAHRQAFRGGNTHANAARSGKIIHWPIFSYDIISSYPAVMITYEGFPVGAFSESDNPDAMLTADPDLTKYAYLIEINMEDVVYRGKSGIPYISESKCEHVVHERMTQEGPEQFYQDDNGRIRKAAALHMVITDIDWRIIRKDYKCSKYSIYKMYYAPKDRLPEGLRYTVMELFRQKTILKDSDNPDDIYMYNRVKAMLNACFGMTTTKIDMDMVIYDPAAASEHDGNEFYCEGKNLDELIEKFYKSRNSFLSYQWGVWITAAARERLQYMLDKVGADVVYCDTDSIKFVGDHEEEFIIRNQYLKDLAEKYGAYADNRSGKRYYLGIWDKEPTMMRFCTLGAKKYIYETWHYSGGQWEKRLHSTIAGVSKKAGADFFTSAGMAAFKVGTIITNSGHLVAYRNDDAIHKITVDGCEMTTASNLALVDDTYTLGVTDTYLELLRSIYEDQKYIVIKD